MSDYLTKGLVYGLSLVGIAGGTMLGIELVRGGVERPPIVGVQRGFRGTAMDQIYNPRTLAELAVQAKVPHSLPPASPDGVKAGVAYKNVQVLKDLSVGQFTRLMVSMTQWVAPKQGCSYCHNVKNMSWDGLYTKVVARRMLQMTQNINGNWQSHVQNVGVTCYTCHGGNPVPKNIWFDSPPPKLAGGMAEVDTGMGHPTQAINWASLPYDPFAPYLEQSVSIRVQPTTPLNEGSVSTIKQTEWTYALMLHFSQALGVNCTYCHNTRAFEDWSQSSPARVTAWYGIRMVRDLNNNYLDPLGSVFPAYRKGELGDSPKINCATCHQGIYKPLYGVSMLSSFKTELGGPPAVQTAAEVKPATDSPPNPVADKPVVPAATVTPATPATPGVPATPVAPPK
jgi:photosynthetic reaction center cytochrome c subunit